MGLITRFPPEGYMTPEFSQMRAVVRLPYISHLTAHQSSLIATNNSNSLHTPVNCTILQEIILSGLSVITVSRWVLLNSGCNFKSFSQRIFKQIRDEHYLVGRKLQNRNEIPSDSVRQRVQIQQYLLYFLYLYLCVLHYHFVSQDCMYHPISYHSRNLNESHACHSYGVRIFNLNLHSQLTSVPSIVLQVPDAQRGYIMEQTPQTGWPHSQSR